MDQKFVLVTSATRLETLVARFNTLSQARFYVEHLGADFGDYQREHDQYHGALETCRRTLETLGRLQLLPREYLPNFLFGPEDLVLALGRDGLVANTLKYLEGQPLIGINPDPQRWDGVLLPFSPAEVGDAVTLLRAGKVPVKGISMAQVSLGDGRKLLGVNDLFVGARSHISSRYTLIHGDRQEAQSSSGIIISTGLGSSGWLKSVVTGAQSIMAGLEDRKKPQSPKKTSSKGSSGNSSPETPAPHTLEIPWDADYLYFTVREPFPSRSSQTNLVFGRVSPQAPLRILSQMPEHGVIFSDGIEQDYLEFSSGTTAQIGLADRKGFLVRKE